jgi:hypothetical protein
MTAMKKLIIAAIVIVAVVACRKKENSPEGPTDVRIRNISGLPFTKVIVSTSENEADIDTISFIFNGATSDYLRFTKAYPKALISAEINIAGSPEIFSTGPVDYTYMQYIGRDKITYEVNISNLTTRELVITNIIEEEPLVLK